MLHRFWLCLNQVEHKSSYPFNNTEGIFNISGNCPLHRALLLYDALFFLCSSHYCFCVDSPTGPHPPLRLARRTQPGSHTCRKVGHLLLNQDNAFNYFQGRK